MKELTNAEFAVLSLLGEAPRHGYELEQVIAERGMRDWTEIGFSSIYYVLAKLEKADLVTHETAAHPKAAKVFSPTEAGYRTLADRTREAIAEPHPVYPSILLGMANWPALRLVDGLAALKARRTAIVENIGRIAGRRTEQEPLPDFVDTLFEFSIGQLEAEREWIDGALISLGGKTMDKVDFKKTLKHLYRPSAKEFAIVEVPKMRFIMVDGHGDPGADSYQRAVEWLYSASYPIKFMSKKELGRDYIVPPMEGLWWADDTNVFADGERDSWQWTMMIMQPDWVTQEMFETGVAKAEKKLGTPPETLRLELFDEGLSVQIMHIGPYADEGQTIARMHQEFIPANGLVENGHHHEIYLGDPRRTAPEKLKTVLRHPVRKV
ncbi:MAG: winged helix DNA-binding protein [Actinobacteria bacterium]|nr:winged helix DNA-binding protein [Actinomycetota bacterium]